MRSVKSISREYGFGSVRWNAVFLNKLISELTRTNSPRDKTEFTLLDIGCGYNSLIRFNDLVKKTGFDAWQPSIDIAKENATHHEFICAEFHELPDLLKDRSFDFIIAIDFIEHLEKKDGWKLLDWMEQNSNIASIIYTPNGFLYQPSIEEGDFQEHKSGWDVSDFRGLGYSCVGGAGAKILRKEFHEIRFKPAFFWSFISLLSQIAVCRWFPRTAAALWAFKIKRQ